MSIRFVTGGDSNYFPTLLKSVRAMQRLHPDSEVWLGDYGLLPAEIKMLAPTKVIKMPKLSGDTGKDFLLKIELCRQVPVPFVYLDGDAVLLHPWDEDPADADLTLTSRTWCRGGINAGVFGCSNDQVFESWHAEALRRLPKEGHYAEQNALHAMAHKFSVKYVPAIVYNWDRWQHERLPPTATVAHLKGKRVGVAEFMNQLPEPRQLPLYDPGYTELYDQLHEEDQQYGDESARHLPWALKHIEQTGSKTVLEYGCGKGTLVDELRARGVEAHGWDPAVKRFRGPVEPADLVVCTDVLEHIEPKYLSATLRDIRKKTLKRAIFVIALRYDRTHTLPDGTNPHKLVCPYTWWKAKLEWVFGSAHVSKLREGHSVKFVCTPI